MKKALKYSKNNLMKLIYVISISIGMLFTFISCNNPFAPKLINTNVASLLGDQTTLEGFFNNWSYAYNFKDTIVYGDLLHENFTFVFKNYNVLGTPEVTWRRQEEMITTARMFDGTQRLELVWNGAIIPAIDSNVVDIIRNFSLTVIFSPTDPVTADGFANLRLVREKEGAPWKMTVWRDDN